MTMKEIFEKFFGKIKDQSGIRKKQKNNNSNSAEEKSTSKKPLLIFIGGGLSIAGVCTFVGCGKTEQNSEGTEQNEAESVTNFGAKFSDEGLELKLADNLSTQISEDGKTTTTVSEDVTTIVTKNSDTNTSTTSISFSDIKIIVTTGASGVEAIKVCQKLEDSSYKDILTYRKTYGENSTSSFTTTLPVSTDSTGASTLTFGTYKMKYNGNSMEISSSKEENEQTTILTEATISLNEESQISEGTTVSAIQFIRNNTSVTTNSVHTQVKQSKEESDKKDLSITTKKGGQIYINKDTLETNLTGNSEVSYTSNSNGGYTMLEGSDKILTESSYTDTTKEARCALYGYNVMLSIDDAIQVTKDGLTMTYGGNNNPSFSQTIPSGISQESSSSNIKKADSGEISIEG